MEIVTKRFLLRDFCEKDAAAFQEYHVDPRSLEFYEDEELKPGHAQQLLETFKNWAAEQPRRNYQFAIVQRQGSQLLVGCGGLRTADSEARKAELGIELAPEFWGRYGYAIEIVHALVDFGFRNLKLSEIYGSTVSVNVRVARLASSFGAVATTRPTPAWMAARGWSQIEWHVTREQWKSGRLWFNDGAPKVTRTLTQKLDTLRRRRNSMDSDLDHMSREQLVEEVRKLRQGIRQHRDSSGHELCWHHPTLWGLLPEKTDPVPAVPDWPQFIQGCVRYRQSLDDQAPGAPRTKDLYEE